MGLARGPSCGPQPGLQALIAGDRLGRIGGERNEPVAGLAHLIAQARPDFAELDDLGRADRFQPSLAADLDLLADDAEGGKGFD